jgi:hypothetical protein
MSNKIEYYVGGGTYIKEGTEPEVHHGIEWHPGEYTYKCNVKVKFDHSRVEYVEFSINTRGCIIDYVLGQRFIDALNQIPNPSNVIRKHIHKMALLEVTEFANNMSKEDYNKALDGLYVKWFE